MRTLREYVSLLQDKGLLIETDADCAALERAAQFVSYDSKEVRPDTLFICKGKAFQPAYLKEAVVRGAFAYVSEEKFDPWGCGAARVIVTDVRKAMAYIAGLRSAEARKKLILAGITGTKGKSTTAYYMKAILDDYLESRQKPESAILSSIDAYDGVIREEAQITTPESLILHRHFVHAAQSGIEYLTMEVSSQGLKYDRTLGVQFDVGCFLNIAEDHISPIEHADFDDYLNAKLLLFKQCKTACVNLDCTHREQVLAAAHADAPKVVTFGFVPEADVYGYDLTPTRDGIAFRARTDEGDRAYALTMHGLFNGENALAAIAMSRVLDIPVAYVLSGLKRARVPGRMEMFRDAKREIDVLVDYAHNKMSYGALFDSLEKEFPGRKISAVFGCTGYKVLGRRRQMGEIAGKRAAKVFITEEDTGEEPLADICAEVAGHVMAQHHAHCQIIESRPDAIRQAIETAEAGEIIIITGKGRETLHKKGKNYVKVPSDADVVEEFLSR